MDLNHVGVEAGPDESNGAPPTEPADAMAAVLAKMEALENRLNAIHQPKNNNGRVPGLKREDVERLRAEGRCFRCKKKGHMKRECTEPGLKF
jgi:hypothetical protein